MYNSNLPLDRQDIDNIEEKEEELSYEEYDKFVDDKLCEEDN